MNDSIEYIHPELQASGLAFCREQLAPSLQTYHTVALAWVQIVACSSFIEFSGGFEEYEPGPTRDYGWSQQRS